MQSTCVNIVRTHLKRSKRKNLLRRLILMYEIQLALKNRYNPYSFEISFPVYHECRHFLMIL